MPKVSIITLNGRLERIPEDEDKFVAWCEENGVDYLGPQSGRRGWWSDLSTYIRGAEYLFTVESTGDRLLLYEDDFTITFED